MADTDKQNTENAQPAFDASKLQIDKLAQKVMKKKEAEKTVPVIKDTPSKPSEVIKFKKDIEILADKKIDTLSTQLTQAYEAVNTQDPTKRLYAVVCNDYLPPRSKSFRNFEGLNNKCMAELIDAGSVYWKSESRRRYVIIFDNIYGKPAFKDLNDRITPLREDAIINKLLIPISSLLSVMKGKSITHGKINVLNLYDNLLDGGKSFAIQPCISEPVGYSQPVIFETIERGMCMASGRGYGGIETDLYALGVVVAMLMIGYNPMAKLTDAEVVAAKLKHGSFSCLMGGQRIPQGLNEVLRGLLCDDIRVRWTLEDIQKWIAGRRMSPRQAGSELKASRSLDFCGKKYNNLRQLSAAFDEHRQEAIKVIEDGSLKKWLDRALGDRAVGERFEMATHGFMLDLKDPIRAETMITRVIIALDPKAPIRYKGLAMMPDSVGMVLTDAAAYQKNLDTIKSLIQKDFISFWLTCQIDTASTIDATATLGQMEAVRSFIRQKTPGNGIERCLYYLNKEAPCLSPHLKNHYVNGPIRMIMALEELAAQSDRPKDPFDQHMAAYLAVHFSGTKEGDIQLLGAYDLKVKYKAILTLLSSLQSYAEIKKLPNLAQWMITVIESVVNNFHSRKLRKKIKADLDNMAHAGDIIGMMDLIENQAIFKDDIIGFSKAQLEFKKLSKEDFKLQKDLINETAGLDEGREVSAIICSILAVIGLFFFMFYHFGAF